MDNLPAAPVPLADTVLAGSASAAAEVAPAVADDVLETADDPSVTAHSVLLSVTGAALQPSATQCRAQHDDDLCRCGISHVR